MKGMHKALRAIEGLLILPYLPNHHPADASTDRQAQFGLQSVPRVEEVALHHVLSGKRTTGGEKEMERRQRRKVMPRRIRFSPGRHCWPSVCPFAPLESSVAACHGFRSKSLALRCWCACRRRAVPGRTWTGRSRCWLPVRFPSKRTPMSCACLRGELRLISLPETLQGGITLRVIRHTVHEFGIPQEVEVLDD